jgi:hypothetical protein
LNHTIQYSDYYEYDVEDLNDGYGGHSYINSRFGNAYKNNRYSSNNNNNNSEKAKLLALQRGRYDPQTVSIYISRTLAITHRFFKRRHT